MCQLQDTATVISKGPFRVVGRKYNKKMTYANLYAIFLQIYHTHEK